MGALVPTASSLALLACLAAAQPSERGSEVVVTYATNDVYALSAVVLGRTILAMDASGRPRARVALVHPVVSDQAVRLLSGAGWEVRVVEPIEPPIPTDRWQDTSGPHRDLSVEYGKLHAWTLPYERALILDADGLVKGSLDALFDERYFRGHVNGRFERSMDRIMCAALLAIRPDPHFPEQLLAHARAAGMHSGTALQGLLNERFAEEWASRPDDERIPMSAHYGVAACATAGEPAAAVLAALREATVVDFQGKTKPWTWPDGPLAFAQCEPVSAYAKLWAAILALPASPSLSRNVRSMILEVERDPGNADGLVQLVGNMALEAVRADAPGAREAYRMLAPSLRFGVGDAIAHELGEALGPGMSGGRKHGTRKRARRRTSSPPAASGDSSPAGVSAASSRGSPKDEV